MNPIDILRMTITALKDRKLRTTLTILGVMVGPATIVSLFAITQGFNVGITEQFEKMGVTTVMVIPESDGELTLHDVTRVKNIDDVELVLPFYQLLATVTSGGYTSTTSITAVNMLDFPDFLPGFSMLEGELLLDHELTSTVIGYDIANPNDPDVTPIGLNQVITISSPIEQFDEQKVYKRSFLVTGIVDKFGAGILMDVDGGIFITFRSGQTITQSNNPNGFYVKVSRPDVVEKVSETISEVLEDVNTISIQQIVSIVQSIIGGVNILLVSVGFTSVIAAFFGIMTTMFTTVTERIKEIGLLKALGYTNRLVLLIFLAEASITGIVGGFVGSIAGSVLAFVLIPILSSGSYGPPEEVQNSNQNQIGSNPSGPADFTITPFVSVDLILLAIFLALVVSTLAGLIPAWRASKYTPVEALRHE